MSLKVNNSILKLLIKTEVSLLGLNISLYFYIHYIKANNDTEIQSNPSSMTTAPCHLIASIQQINSNGFIPV